jgi:hypothetical protein
MIGIKYNGSFLEMPGRYSLNMVINSSLFRFKEIEGDWAYGFTLPLSDHNRKALNWPDLIENSDPTGQEYLIELWLENDFWKFGTMTVQNVVTGGIEVNLKTGPGEFVTKLSNKKLKDIDFNNDERIPEAYRYLLTLILAPLETQTSDNIYVDIWDGTFGHTHYNYTGYCTEKLLKDSVSLFCDQINADSALHNMVASYKNFSIDESTGNQRCFFYLRQVEFVDLASIAEITLDYQNFPDPVHLSNNATPIDNNSVNDEGFGNLKKHMNNLLLWPYYRDFFNNCHYCFPYMYNRNWGNEQVLLTYPMPSTVEVNTYLSGSYIIDMQDFPIQQAVPFPILRYVIERVIADLGYRLTGDFFTYQGSGSGAGNELENLILGNVVIADIFEEWESLAGPGISSYFIGHMIDIKNHVGEISCGDLLLSLKTMFGAAYDFDAKLKACRMTTMKSVLAEKAYNDWTSKTGKAIEIMPNEYKGLSFKFTLTMKDPVDHKSELPSVGNSYFDLRLVLDHNFWYVWKLVDIGTAGGHPEWVGIGEFMNDLIINDGSEEVVSGISPTSIFIDQYVSSQRLTVPFGEFPKTVMPVAMQPGNSYYFTLENEYTPKILFWRGLHKDGDNNNYPLASMDVYDYGFNKIANFAIKWDGQYGLVAQFLQDVINFLKGTKQVTFPLYLEKADLINLDMFKKKFIDRNLYFPDRLELNFNEDGLGDQVGYFNLYRPKADGNSFSVFEPDVTPCTTLDWLNPNHASSELDETIAWILEADGCCEGMFEFSLYSGNLPPGLELVDNEITGTITDPCGTYEFTIMLIDNCGNIRYYVQKWVVLCCEDLEWINPSVVTDLETNQAVNWALMPDGCCEGIFEFSISDGILPPELTLADNRISGNTTENPGEYTFTVKLIDNCGNERFYPKIVVVSTP